MFKERTSDYILSFAPFFQFAVLMLQDLLVSADIVAPGSFRIFSIILASLPMIPALLIVFHRNRKMLLITYAIVLYLILFTLAFFPQNQTDLTEGSFYLLGINIPCFLCLMSIKDFELLKKTMLYISFLISVLGLAYTVFLTTGAVTLKEYDMAFGYYLLLPAVVYLNQRKLIYTFMFILTCIMIFIIGSRGPLLAAFFYSIMLLLIDGKSRFNMLIISGIVVLIIFVLNTFLLDLLSSADLSSRTLTLILQGDISNDSERYGLYSLVWNGILDSPVWGHGIYGDRLILDGLYTHNFFLEFIYNFGLYVGSLLLLFFSYVFGRAFYKSNVEGRKLLLMFFCYCFIPLLFSRSYLNDPGFGILVGVVFAMPMPLYQNKLHI